MADTWKQAIQELLSDHNRRADIRECHDFAWVSMPRLEVILRPLYESHAADHARIAALEQEKAKLEMALGFRNGGCESECSGIIFKQDAALKELQTKLTALEEAHVRLQVENEASDGQLKDWRSWAQFVYMGGGKLPEGLTDKQIQQRICEAHDKDTEEWKECAELFQRAAMLKDRTRSEMRRRVAAGETAQSVAGDFEVPVGFVDHLVSWQIGGGHHSCC